MRFARVQLRGPLLAVAAAGILAGTLEAGARSSSPAVTETPPGRSAPAPWTHAMDIQLAQRIYAALVATGAAP